MHCHFKNNLISKYGEHKGKTFETVENWKYGKIKHFVELFAISDVFASFKLTVGHSFY